MTGDHYSSGNRDQEEPRFSVGCKASVLVSHGGGVSGNENTTATEVSVASVS